MTDTPPEQPSDRLDPTAQAPDEPPVRRPRRRPTHRAGRPTLSSEGIGRAALELLSHGGASAVTMRALADRLHVSPRALYNYAADRRAVLCIAAYVWQSDWRTPELDPTRWRESLSELCHDLRAWYRRYPRAVTLAVDENLSSAVHPRTLLNNDAILAFLLGIGLDVRDAHRVHREIVLRVAAFVRLVDAWHDAPPPELDPEEWDAPPVSWITANPELDLPVLRRVTAEVAPEAPDEQFDFTVEMLCSGVAVLLRRTTEKNSESAGHSPDIDSESR